MAEYEGITLKYFVLKPKGNDKYAFASRQAMLIYSELIKEVNPVLAKNLKEWSTREQDLKFDKEIEKVNKERKERGVIN